MKITAAILALVAGIADAHPLPHHVGIHYNLSRDGLVIATLDETLEHSGNAYTINSVTQAVGIATFFYKDPGKRASSGTITPAGLRPRDYDDQRGKDSRSSAHFDWEKMLLTMVDNGKPEQHELTSATTDRLSFFYNFAFAQPAEKELSFVVTDGRHLPVYRYEVKGTETLSTPIGDLETLHLVYIKDAPDDKSSDLWLAVKYHLLPVRFLIVDKNGVKLDQVITKIAY